MTEKAIEKLRRLIKNALESGDDYELEETALMKDVIFNKSSENERRQLIDQATEVGKKGAQDILDELGVNGPYVIVEKLGAKIKYDKKGGISGPVICYAEYVPIPKPPTLLLHTKAITKMKSMIRELKLQEKIPTENIQDAFVAHELFHHLERERIGEVSDRFKRKAKFGPFKIDYRIVALSDTAANAFAKTLLNSSYSPRIFEFITLLWAQINKKKRKKEKKPSFRERMKGVISNLGFPISRGN